MNADSLINVSKLLPIQRYVSICETVLCVFTLSRFTVFTTIYLADPLVNYKTDDYCLVLV